MATLLGNTVLLEICHLIVHGLQQYTLILASVMQVFVSFYLQYLNFTRVLMSLCVGKIQAHQGFGDFDNV